MQLEDEEHTAGAQLASTINRMSPLTHSIHIPDLGLVCGLRICIIMVEAPSLPGSPGAVAARRDGRILWHLGDPRVRVGVEGKVPGGDPAVGPQPREDP